MNNNSESVSDMQVKKSIRKPKYKRVVTPTILQMEMVECGAASLAMILAYYGKFVPLEIVRQECGVTRDGVKAGNIVKAADKMGLSTEGYRKEPADLADIPVPAIIHWNFNHFVVFEGFKGGKAFINDPASGHRAIPYDEFDMAFTGVVLIFEKKETFKREGKQSNMLGALAKRISSVKKAVAFLIAVGFLMVIPGLIIPSFTRIFIDNYLLSGESEILTPLLICMAVTAVIQICLTMLREHFLLRMEAKIAINGAGKFFWHILRLPVLFFQQRSPGDISSRMSCNDSVAEFLSSEFTSNVINVLTLVFYFCVMLNYNVALALISLAFACVNVVYFIYSSNKVEELNRKISQDAGKLYGTSISGLALIETLKATGAESGFFSKWAGYHSKQLNGEQKMGALSQLLFAIPNLMSGLSNVLVLCVGGVEILNGNMTVGALIAFQGLLGSFMAPISGLTNMGMKIKQLKADMIRLDDVHKYSPDYIADPERDVAPDEAGEDNFGKLSGNIEINNLTFGYNLLAPPLIENFSLKLKPGSRVALVGGSGSGKSTVAKLIAGINHPWDGEILFDGKSRKDLPRNVIANSLAVVDQDISMFAGEIRDNIAMWDKTAQDEDILSAAKDARIHDDVEKRDGGYRAEVSEGGMNFSGGQKQRLEIARALAINPSILILDEATSALDVQTEQIVSENIRRRGCTCVIVAHRLSTIRDCDEIIVMKNGKIVQRGIHDEMKDTDGPYAELIKSGV